MPGSLPGSNGSDDEMEFDGSGEEADEDGYGYEGEHEVEAAEDTFDDEFFAPTNNIENEPPGW